mgnify:CR=1 FL=1
MKSALYVGLVHYPIYDKNFNVIATAITNYDLHDISRSSKTYGVKKYFIIHHVQGQLDMVHKIIDFWESPAGRKYNSYRTQAFDIVDIRPSIEAAVEAVAKAEGKRPYVVTTGCMPIRFPTRTCAARGKKTIRPSCCSLVRDMV